MTEITRQTVLDYLAANPGDTNKRDIAKGLGVNGEARRQLRQILKELEDEGVVSRVGKRAFARNDTPPPTGIVEFIGIDEHGDLIGKAVGREGLFGPDLLYAGPRGRRRDPDPGVKDRALCDIEEGRDGLWRARMIKRIETRKDTLIGIFEQMKHGGGTVESTSRKDKRSFLIFPGDQGEAVNGDLVRCEPRQSRGHGPKRGKIIEVLGNADNPRAASLIAMAAHDIPDTFEPEVIAAAEAAEPVECPREDLTSIPLITIDPADARDHDDAVFAEPDPDPKNPGGWRIIVAIADVSAFVPFNGILDKEAYRRSNSTYFPDRVASMLPKALSAGECSLKEGELRCCLAFEMFFSKDGSKLRRRILRGMMRSAAGVSYEEAQDAIDGKPGEKAGPLLEPVLKPLWAAWHALDKKRSERAPLDLDIPERKVELSPEGEVLGVRVRERFDAHKLIEEMMIQANVCAAEALETKRSDLIYRVHAEPSDEKIHGLSTFLDTLELTWSMGEKVTPARFNRLLAIARETDRHHEISEIVLRTQSQAIYSPDNLGHFGLNLSKYAHFTSPIRRYSDLIVHRALIRAYNLGPDGLPDEQRVRLEEIAGHLVDRERASMAAERDASDRYLTAFLADRVGAEFEGRVTGVAKFGLFVRLDETAADGFIPAASLGNEFWYFDDSASALVADRSGRRYELGQPVRVKLTEANSIAASLVLEMLSDPRPKRKGEEVPSKHRHKRVMMNRKPGIGSGPRKGPRKGKRRR
ncbi:ribonuclease R [Ponticaulis sp.]|uniref:ribonuclease R n=1 Tax=Ponticaulis sp. TaxID=2020902 RepID=UPI000B64186A|nr:ribonuclease R [Ponticaulis sp.]MAI89627.1 ribonuclease R [Ponticaulis sp.]OUY00652.1 MAG: ribonuclease R [Hyphomonadaceae bacterium TMED5]|tara:strand:- start:162548 stop:164806 length:2259 start_codon:yes stop_codon:yes gene_type:complete